jgi:hypothetical protein
VFPNAFNSGGGYRLDLDHEIRAVIPVQRPGRRLLVEQRRTLNPGLADSDLHRLATTEWCNACD